MAQDWGGAYSNPWAGHPNWQDYVDSLRKPSGGGGFGYGGGGGTSRPTPKPITWRSAYSAPGAPSWWRGLIPNRFTPETEFIATYNALIPFLSPEDQRTVATYFYGALPQNQLSAFKGYNPAKAKFTVPSFELSTLQKEQYTSADRAKMALQTLNQLKQAAGKKQPDMGTGYRFLQNFLQTMKSFGGGKVGSGERQTRAQYQQMRAALDPMIAQTRSGDLSPYASLVKQLAQPYFTAGAPTSIAKNAAGRYVFGKPNQQFFG